MRLRNKKTGEYGDYKILSAGNLIRVIDSVSHDSWQYDSLAGLYEKWEDYTPKEPLIKDEKICKLVREWAKYNGTESVVAYNLVFDHGGVCIKNELVRFYDPLLRTSIAVFLKSKAPKFNQNGTYTIEELCGEEEECES